MTRYGRAFGVATLMLLFGSVAACGGGDDGGDASATQPAGSSQEPLRGEVTVFAAASLTDAFREIAEAFKIGNPDVDFVFNFQGSPTLRTQLEQGARADVFASANLEQMEIAKTNEVVRGDASTFARNSLVIITPSDNPGGIEAPADLAKDGLKLVVANEDVPAGAYTREMLTKMDASGEFEAGFADKVSGNFVSLESNVKQVVAKVELGEADGGVVYGSDVTPDVAPNLTKIEVPEAFNVIAEYPMALVKDASNAAAARAFIDFVLSEAGQAMLAKYGFLSAG